MSDGANQGGEGTGGSLPARFGTYRVEALIGAGGMGIVYRALDEDLQRLVALKTLLPALAADPEFVARFKREAQSAAALNHPNITQIYSIGQEGAIPFFAMEMIHGRSLEALVKERGALDAIEATGYIVQAAKGLRHAAQKKLIHRDVKPSNLMLAEDGVVKITDFGLAKAAKSDTQLTATGQVLGSPGYISPEQAQGGEIDARSDLYSLGATFYHLVVGRLPFEAPTPVAMIIKHMNEPLRSPRAANPAIPYPIASAIQKLMAKRPGERFQDYDSLLRELDRALATARPADAAQPAPGTGAAAPAWTGMTGMEARGARPRGATARPAAAAPTPGHGGAWLPAALVVALGAMIVAGIIHHQRSQTASAAPLEVSGTSQAGLSAPPPDTGAGAAAGSEGGVEVSESFRLRPGPAPLRVGGRDGRLLEERLRDRLPAQQGKASLTFVSKDRQILPDGRIKVTGQVRNTGVGVAGQARVRIRLLREDGSVATENEAPLAPPTIAPGATSFFELTLDGGGGFATIKAELLWIE